MDLALDFSPPPYIANFKSDPLDQVDDFTGATLRVPSAAWVEMGRNVVGRFEILILLSYEVAASLEEDGRRRGMWYPSERNRAVREKLQSLRR